MARRRASLPTSHSVNVIPETPKAALARGACPRCGRVAVYYEHDMDQCAGPVAVYYEHDMDQCAGPVAVCRRCGWNDYDEQQAAHLRNLMDDPGFTTGCEG